MRRYAIWALALASLPLSGALAQETRVVTAADRDYAVSGINRWLRGSDYRELWLEPIEVPVLDVETVGGGLTPRFTVGDGRGLAMVGEDGRSYTFRAIDKDLALELPESWYYTLPGHLIQDQTVADHPAANVIAAHLTAAVGVLHTLPRLVVMPDSERLGELGPEFAGRLGTIEEYPTSRSAVHSGFHDATEIVSTAEVWRRTLAGDGRPDARALLRARLLDMVLNDWDRHQQQFRWARIPGHEHWQPIPEDHDHAFVSYEGFALAVARTRWPRFVRFRDRIDQLDGLNAKGHQLDRWILSGLPRDDYLQIAEEIVAALPDPVIRAAVETMPPEYHPLSADPLTRRLQRRRDDLVRAAGAFYEDLARQVDVHGTDLADEMEVDHEEGRTRVRARTSGRETWLERVFHLGETDRVRLHLEGGADSVTVRGRDGVAIAVIAGPGRDRVDGGDQRVVVYDVEPDDVVTGSRLHVEPLTDNARVPVDAPPWQTPRDRGSHLFPFMWSSIEPDSSLFLGAGLSWTRYDLRTFPFAARHRVGLGFSTGRSAPRFQYEGTFRRPQSSVFYELDAWADALARHNYHGLGNETVRGDAADDFFEAKAGELGLAGSLSVETGPESVWSIGASLTRFANDDEETLLAIERPYGFGPFVRARLRTGWRLDTRRRRGLSPQKGWRERSFRLGDPYVGTELAVGADLAPPVLDVENWFGGVDGFVTRYVPLERRLTLAVRVGGRHVWGRFPWQASAFIGGDDSVRGYRPQRFAGRSSAYGNLELRYVLQRATIILPGELGVFVLGDVGRVWADDAESDKWHPATGGGLFFVLPELESVFHLGVAVGNEGPLVHLGTGFGI